MEKDKLVAHTVLFNKYYGECYGIEYIIKSDRSKKNPKFAIFIRKENMMRRKRDEVLKKVEMIDIADMLILIRPKKEEGIPLLKTLSKYV